MKKHLRLPFALFLLVSALVGCGKTHSADSGGENQQRQGLEPARPAITGRVIDSEGIAKARVELRLLRSRAPLPATTASTTTDDNGYFSVLPLGEGPYEVVAQLPLQADATYSAYVSSREDKPIVVSPLTTMAAGLAQHRFLKQDICSEAINSSFDDMSQHLLITDLAHTQPAPWPVPSQQSAGAKSSNAALQAQLVVQGLKRVATQLETQANKPAEPLTLAALSKVFADDLKADGVLDGQGPGGKRLQLAGQTYDGAILRSQLAKAILSTIDASPSETFGADGAYCPTAEKLASNQGKVIGQPLYPGDFSCQPARLVVKGVLPVPAGTDVSWRADAWSIDRNGERTQRHGQVDVENHAFTIDLVGVTEPIMVRAYPSTSDSAYYYAYVPVPKKEETEVRVSLQPLSTLVAAYAQALMRSEQKPLEQAMKASHFVFKRHFGVDVADAEAFGTFDPDTWLGSNAPLGRAGRSHLLCAAMAHLAEATTDFGSDPGKGWDKLLSLTSMLAEDVAADKRFDGVGVEGRALAMEGYQVTGKTLRLDLSRSLLSTLHKMQSNRDAALRLRLAPSSSLQEAQGWARSLSASKDDPFLSHADPAPTGGPSFAQQCYVLREQAREPLPEVLRGTLDMECDAGSGHFLSSVSVHARTAGAAAPVQGEAPDRDEAVTNVQHTRQGVKFTLDTRALSATGEDKYIAEIGIVATDTLGVSEITRLTVPVDNIKPSMVCTDCLRKNRIVTKDIKWLGPNDEFRATLQIAGHPPFSVAAQSAGLLTDVSPQGEAEGSPQEYVLTAHRPDPSSLPAEDIAVSITDGAGNESAYTIAAKWSAEGPRFAERGLSFAPANEFPPTAHIMPLDDGSGALGVATYRYAHHLDYLPEEGPMGPFSRLSLPTLSIHLTDDEAEALPAGQVEYRATPYADRDFRKPLLAAEELPWRLVLERPSPEYAARSLYLPLSFQTLLPQSLLSNPGEAQKAIEMVLHDQSGHGPAAWQIDIRATNGLGMASTRTAKVMIHTKLPAPTVASVNSDEWCHAVMADPHLVPHRGLAKSRVEWSVNETPGSLFRLPALNIDLSFPQPPVTTIEETAWRMQNHGREVSKKEGRFYEDKVARQCEQRTDGTHHGIFIKNTNRCQVFPSEQLYWANTLPGSTLLPLTQEEKVWMTSSPTVVHYTMKGQSLDITPPVADRSTKRRSPMMARIDGQVSGRVNNRWLLSTSPSVVYKDGKRQAKTLSETIERIHTEGTVRFDFSVDDPFLKLDMPLAYVEQRISCDPPLNHAWVD